jgi:hypothetical protein
VLWDLIRVVIALVAMIVLYLIGAALVRNFATGIPDDDELEPKVLTDVDLRYRCIVCAAEVVMYAAPDADGELPIPPRHCAERMELIAPIA